MTLQDANLQLYEKNSFTHPLSCIFPSFSQNASASKEGFKVCEYNFFQRKVVLLVLLVIYLFNHDSSKSSIFMLNMAFDVLLNAVFVKYCEIFQ